jgi:5'-nucleotidase, C-terminal domain/Galactose oxidase, central domain
VADDPVDDQPRGRTIMGGHAAPGATGRSSHIVFWTSLSALVVGLVLGVLQPLVFVYVGAGFYAGPTYLGLVFLLCVAVVVLLGPVVLLFRGAREAGVPILALSGCLALGMLAGNVVVINLRVGWAERTSPKVSPTGAGWTATGSLLTARSDHTATLLADGRVLVAGGRGPAGEQTLASAELYDPATGSWTATGSMPSPQANHTSTLLADGRVLVTGYTGAALLYDPGAGTWSVTGSMGTARHDHAATLLADGRVLVSGGRGADDQLAPPEVFDPSVGTWSPAGTMRLPRAGHTATLLPDGRVLVAGGNGAVESESNPMGLLVDAELYDPASNSWSPTAPMLTRRSEHAAVRLSDGRVLVLGGAVVGPGAEIYDPRTADWGPGGLSGSWMSPQALLLDDGRVLAVDALGSISMVGPGGTGVTIGSAGRWHPAVASLANGMVLFAGGYEYQVGSVDAVHLYDPATARTGPVPMTPPVAPSASGPLAPAPAETSRTPAPPEPSLDPAAVLAERVKAFSDRVAAATSAIPRKVQQARQPGESLGDYAVRAQDQARMGAGPIRDLVEQERRSLAALDTTGCPAGTGYRVLLGAYSLVANAIWAALYAPDEALLTQGLADLERLNASVATAVGAIAAASDACAVTIDVGDATLANRIVGTQSVDILRSPDRLHESTMGNFVADAMRSNYPDVDAALLNSGGLRADLVADPPAASEQAGEITWGELLAVLPFGNRTVRITVTGEQLLAALRNGFAPACDPAFAGGTGRFPQLSGLRVRFRCEGPTPVVDALLRAGEGPGEPDTAVGLTDRIRLVTVDYLLAGGDGYALAGDDVREPGDTLLTVVMDYAAASSPLAPAVNGRIVGP